MRTGLRALWLVVAALVALALLLFGALLWLDGEDGRAFAVRQLPRYAPESGLTVRAERIDGSLFGGATVHGLRIGDEKGDFLVVPVARLDWRPRDLIGNTLTIRALEAPEVRLLRRPALRPTADERILPDIDIAIGRLLIERLVLSPAAIGAPGPARVVRVAGRADIRAGRALIDLDARALATRAAPGGDVVRVKLDTEPDRDRFDVAADIEGPRGGVIAGLLGLDAPLAVTIGGDGRWSAWRGVATARLGGAPLADLALGLDDGRFSATGVMQPAGLLTGISQRLAAPRVDVRAAATLDGRVARASVKLASAAVTAAAEGGLDFGKERFDGLTLDARLLRPAAIDPRFAATDARLRARVAGTFAAPLVDYAVTAARASWGGTRVVQVRAVGIASVTERPLAIPLAATAARVEGFGAEADALLRNVRLAGPVRLVGGELVADRLTVRTSRLNARAAGRLTLASGAFRARIDGRLPGYALAGLGVADLAATVDAVSAAGGARVTGRAAATVTRIDNAGVRAQLGGLPRITALIDLAPSGALAFRDARFVAPRLTLTGAGAFDNGRLRFTGAGKSVPYGPLTLAVSGAASAPRVELGLTRPGLGVGLRQVRATIEPAGGAFRFAATGDSDYGPLDATGVYRTDRRPPTIELSRASAAGVVARGTLIQTAAGPFAGALTITGRGLDGGVTLAAAGTVQRADVALDARQARFDIGEPVTVGAGQLRAIVLLPAEGPTVTGRLVATDIVRGDSRLARAEGVVDYRAGRGSAKFSATGRSGAPFSLAAGATFAPDRIVVDADGTYDTRKLGLAAPAVLTRVPGGWRLAPTTLATSDGRAEISGEFGDATVLKARLDGIGLSILQLYDPALDFSGRIFGTLDVGLPAGGGLPTADVKLRVAGLSRAGLATSSLPIDLGVNAVMIGGRGSARAVIVRGGRIEGRVQAALGPIPAGDGLVARLLAAPLFGQARYVGPAQAIWPLAGVEALDVRGQLTVAADVGGRLGAPTLTGRLTSTDARVEQATLGAVVDQLAIDGRFTASRLEIVSFKGRAGSGTLSGSGRIELAAETGFAMDIRLQAENARLLGRDDLTASATGPLRIAGGLASAEISGKLDITRARFDIGRRAVDEVPVLAVREVNVERLGRPRVRPAPATRFTLDIQVKADNKLDVTGMGLDSEWSADLRLTGPATLPRIVGRVQIVRGDYDFAGKRFRLTTGDLRFTGAYPPDPTLNVIAQNDGADITAQLTVTGSAQKPRIAFTSVPALPEDEVLSRVLFGSSVTDLSAPEAIQLAAALASLRGGSGGFNPMNVVRKGLGIDRLRILPADAATGRRTAVAAGEYIGDKVYVEIATDAQGYTATNIEYALTRSLSVLSQVATLGGNSVNLRWKKDY